MLGDEASRMTDAKVIVESKGVTHTHAHVTRQKKFWKY